MSGEQKPVVEVLRDSLAALRDDFAGEAKSVSKGNGSAWSMMRVCTWRDETDRLLDVLAAAPREPAPRWKWQDKDGAWHQGHEWPNGARNLTQIEPAPVLGDTREPYGWHVVSMEKGAGYQDTFTRSPVMAALVASSYAGRVEATPLWDDPPPAPHGSELQRDAERYRWLRDPNIDVGLVLDKVVGETPMDEQGYGGYKHYEYRAGEELDTAIDAAIQARRQKGDR